MKRLKTLFALLFTSGIVYCIAVLGSGCAQIGMPVGGPKDTLPPVLVNANPPNRSVQFKANRITLTFDEYIQLDNPIQNVIVSPLPKKAPFIDFKLKTVTVKLYDTLKAGKTYSIQFGKTIRDLNENNPFSDFDYVFSTGSFIDSLTLSGNVTLAETGRIDSTLTVMLYSDLTDSAVFKQKPEYISRLNKEGNFTFKYLSPGTYHLFALKDEGGQYIYNNPQQIFAFYDTAIDLKPGFEQKIQLYAYQEEKQATKPAALKADTALKFTTNLKSGFQELTEPLILTFNHPLKSFDSGRIILTDTLFKPVTGVRYETDTADKVVSILHAWPGGTEFRLVLPEGSVTDTNGLRLAKNDTLKFKTKNESDYGTIKLNFKNLEKYENPVLLMGLENAVPEAYPLTSATFEKKLMLPGTYYISILEDRNQNGRWDPGNYAERRQPEIVHRLPEPINIRANWENEKDVEL